MAQEQTRQPDSEDLKASGRDMSKAAILVAGLSFLLLVVFFFFINDKLTSMGQRVDALNQVQERMAAMENRFGAVEVRVAELATLPAQARRQAQADALAEMSGRLDSLAERIGNEQQAQALQRVRQLLVETGQGLRRQ